MSLRSNEPFVSVPVGADRSRYGHPDYDDGVPVVWSGPPVRRPSRAEVEAVWGPDDD